MPPAPAKASSNGNARERKAVIVVGEPPEVASRHSQVETEKVVRRECGEGGKASEKEVEVEIRKEGTDHGATVEENELYEEGCSEILTIEELKFSEEVDL